MQHKCLHMTSTNTPYKSLKEVSEALILPKDLGHQDSDLQELIAKDTENTRLSTFRKSNRKL